MLKSPPLNKFCPYPQALWISLCMSLRIAPRKAHNYRQLLALVKF